MKGVIIAGEQGIGKSELAKLICSGKNTIYANNISDLKSITAATECIVIKEISSKKDWEHFKELLTMQSFKFRPPYKSELAEISVGEVLLISTTQSEEPLMRNRPNLKIFKLKK